MIRTKGEAGTGNIVEAVRHLRSILGDIRRAHRRRDAELYARGQGAAARRSSWCRRSPSSGELPVADLLRRRHRHAGRRGADDAARRDGVFVGCGIFKSDDPATMAQARSSRRPRTSATPTSCRRSRAASARRWPG